LKISIPLIELVKNEAFKKPILDAIGLKATQASNDCVNLQDDKPTVVLSLMTEPADDNSPSFYVSLNIHDKILHNCLLDTGANHNIIPKAVMDELGLDIIRPYHDFFSFDSRKVKCLGLIKDLAITLSQLPMNIMITDIVVADVPPKFDMLLSIGWIKRLGGTLQNDLSYATVPVFGGESRRLYREALLAYITSDERNPTNHPIYAVDTDFGVCILQIEESQLASVQLKKPVCEIMEEEGPQIWDMFFDGACSREAVGAGVVLISPTQECIHLSFKLTFPVTNNITEYEALILVLNAAKEMGIKDIKVFRDIDLIIQQVNKTFQGKHPRLKAYRDEVWRLKYSFSSFCISYIPRVKSQLADSLAMSTSMFIPPMPPKVAYEIQVKYRPSLPDNVRYWKVFEDDDEVNRFLQVIDEFSEMKIDQENEAKEEGHQSQLRRKIGQDNIVQLPSNHIPKGLVPLEKLFDHNDVPYKPAQKENESAVHRCNIGSPYHPTYINLSTHLSTPQSSKYCILMKQFVNGFSWEYNDLKTYNKNIL